MSPADILHALTERFGEKVTPFPAPPAAPAGAIVDRDNVRPILAFLRDDPRMAFDLLADVTAVDHLLLEDRAVRERFAVVYQLQSLAHNHRFRLKARVPAEDPVLPSVSDLWSSALWGERETHDMYGIEFEGSPDMRRLLMPEDYPGFPLRKDYPLRGKGERDAFPQVRSAAEGKA